jgi:uncharacterized protein (DUF1697 family)
MNAKMPELKQAFAAAGFTDVKTLLSSGNVVFSARSASTQSLQRKAEAAMLDRLGQAFLTIVRPVDALREMLASDPYKAFRLSPGSKRIVTFLREPRAKKRGLQRIRAESQGSRIHGAHRADVRQRSDDAHVGDCGESREVRRRTRPLAPLG